MDSLEDALKKNKTGYADITPYNLNKDSVVVLDFSKNNKELEAVDINEEYSFSNYVLGKLTREGSKVGIGGYNEDRIIYRRSSVFDSDDGSSRSIHLGIDIWAEAGTPIFAPLKGKIHSFKNNSSHGDYGPTIIIEHRLQNLLFYSLYGHLSKQSLKHKEIGQRITKGEKIADLGKYEENVHWPPHLHFQLIKNLDDHWGDYPGVAQPSEKEKYLNNCPDPNLILKVHRLG